ncbi:MAG: CHAP domain-containing protein [Candidatus Dormibacteria bacterium]
MSGDSTSPLRLAIGALVVALVLAVVLIAAAAGAVVEGFAGIASPAGLASAPASDGAAAAGWPWGQCTWYVAVRRAQMGEPVTWGGDAWQWLTNAEAQGKPTASTPYPGEIVVYRRGGPYDSRYGHVAFVVAVTPTSYTVSEANYYGLGVIDSRSIAWPDPHVAGFIV